MVYDVSKDDRVTSIQIGNQKILTLDPEFDWIITQVFYPDATKTLSMDRLTIVIEKREKDHD